jgi:AcrR family transcriptional regulator
VVQHEDLATPGLRERKKQRTRDALIRASVELFAARGYENTTVDEIVEVVDVSQRTFFRYFASKEDAAFALINEIDDRLVQALGERPPEEGPLEALRGAVRETWTRVGEQTRRVNGVTVLAKTLRLVESAPGLTSAYMRRSMALEERLTNEIARREHVIDPADPRPRLVVAVFSAVARTASRCWGLAEDADLALVAREMENHFDRLLPALADDWGRPSPVQG